MRVHVKVVPVLFVRNLCVQRWVILANIRPFHAANFLHDFRVSFLLGIVKNLKRNSVTLLFGIGQDAILVLCFQLDPHIMLCQPMQHICTLPDVNQLFIYVNPINASVVKFFLISLSLQHLVNIFCVSCHGLLSPPRSCRLL